ncbi:hypothetical protein ACN6MY_12610 [Peribacillus sp. B-H-3]|uniref:hypothetical protein n=1 Tax=Peribacillus sp. B-H-3 TaxID=3400420 RepID=UPI003B01381C
MSLVVTLIIFTGCLIFGIKLWKRSRLFSLFLIVPVFLILLFVGYCVFNSWYHTTPASLNFSYHNENGRYTITGVWKKPLDAYRFPTDFIVFYVINNEKVSNVKRTRYEEYKQNGLEGLRGISS